MRKSAVTIFAVLYATLVISVSAERSMVWAAKESARLTHHLSSHDFPGIGKVSRSDSHLSQTKLVETEFVVELPIETTVAPLPSKSQSLPSVSVYLAWQSGQGFSSRAPPFLI